MVAFGSRCVHNESPKRNPTSLRLSILYTVQLLAWTDQHRSVNKMTLQNLLMVFCPSLNLSPPFLRYLIENHRNLFKDLDDPLTPLASDINTNASSIGAASNIINASQRNIILSPVAISLPPTPTTTAINEDTRSAGSLRGLADDTVLVTLGVPDHDKSLPESPVTPTAIGSGSLASRGDTDATPKSNLAIIKDKRRSKLTIPNAFLADSNGNGDGKVDNPASILANTVSRSFDSSSSSASRSAGNSPLINGDGNGFLTAASNHPGERRSATPIADRFRRTGPVEITLREKSGA